MHCAWLLYILNVNNVEIEVGPDSGQVPKSKVDSTASYQLMKVKIYSFDDKLAKYLDKA